MHMADWIAKLDDFLRLSDRDILTHAGKISHQLAEEHAHAQYALHEQQRQRLEAEQPASDFDRAVQELTDQHGETAKPKRRPKKSGKKPHGGPSMTATLGRAIVVWWHDLDRWAVPSAAILSRRLPTGWTLYPHR